jgi:uncharacterized membrane protein YccC
MENRSQNSPRPDPIGLNELAPALPQTLPPALAQTLSPALAQTVPPALSPESDPDPAAQALANLALNRLAQTVQELAQQAAGSSTQLLALLRVLESSHREICEGAFQQSLPNTRQNLHFLLRDIESQGGWPYIPRLKLQRLLTALEGPVETAMVVEPDDQPAASA